MRQSEAAGGGQEQPAPNPADQANSLSLDALVLSDVEAGKFNVAFVYAGPVGDGRWRYAHNQGREYIADEFSAIYCANVSDFRKNRSNVATLCGVIECTTSLTGMIAGACAQADGRNRIWRYCLVSHSHFVILSVFS